MQQRNKFDYLLQHSFPFSVAGRESLVAEALEEFDQNTFHNYLEYLLVILDMPANTIDEYKRIEGFKPRVVQILKNWTKSIGPKANLGFLMEKLRNHRSINGKNKHHSMKNVNYVNYNHLFINMFTEKVYKATMASVGTAV